MHSSFFLLSRISSATISPLKQSMIGETYSLPSAHCTSVISVRNFSEGRWALMGGKRRILRRQVVFPQTDSLSGAEWAPRFSSCSGVDGCLPRMSVLTAPPDLLPAAVGNAMRRQGKVLSAIPLRQHTIPSVFHTEVIERLSHRVTSRSAAMITMRSGLLLPAPRWNRAFLLL